MWPKSLIVCTVICIIPTVFSRWSFTTVQSVRITGRLLCYGEPAANVSIKLFDEDLFGMDTMDHTRSDSAGNFVSEGVEDEAGWIDPSINVYHKCGIENPTEYKNCVRTVTIGIPQTYVTEGPIPEKTFELGSFELKNLYGQENDKRCGK